MILSPLVLALVAMAILVAAYSLYAAGAGLRLLAGWQAGSAAEAQLRRERKTSLLSSLLGLIMLLDLLCLGVFVVLADRLHGYFTGAMCAAGTLNANPYGQPTLLVMLAGFVLCVLWSVVNSLDAQAPDFPLLRLKYLGLLPVAVLLVAQVVLLVRYFLGLNPTLITSCCGTLFNEAGRGIGSELAHLPAALMEPLFWTGWLVTVGVGGLAMGIGLLDRLYAGLSAVMLPLALASIVSFISIYIYELPTHHCPFCLLHPEFGYLGYPLYAGLLLGTALGMGTGLARTVGRAASLRSVVPRVTRRLRAWSLAGYCLLGATVGWPRFHAHFTP